MKDTQQSVLSKLDIAEHSQNGNQLSHIVQCTLHSTQVTTAMVLLSGTYFSVCSERLVVRAMATAMTASSDISAKLSNKNKSLGCTNEENRYLKHSGKHRCLLLE